MLSFKQFITEQKNLHMLHLEQLVLQGGVIGTRNAINYLQAMRDMLAGKSSRGYNTTVKFDGAPALVAGIVPPEEEKAGQFFVAKKSVFNKNPKYYTTEAEINQDLSGDLASKMSIALRNLKNLGIKGIVQGDFLFTKEDLKKETIDGIEYVTFHPNTIVYTVPIRSDLGRKILNSSIGVVWHTTYQGNNFADLKASFGKNIASKLNDLPNVWSIDATYQDVSGTATFTEKESEVVTKYLSEAGKLFRKINVRYLTDISSNEELVMRMDTFFNTRVRQNRSIENVDSFVTDLIQFVDDYYQKQADSKKTESSKKKYLDKKQEMLSMLSNKSQLKTIYSLMDNLIMAKNMIVSKMNKAGSLKTMLLTKDGFEVTGQEGFVAISRDGNAVKLVNRLEFSRANFSSDVIKGFER
jgi:hypothetical protein